MASELAFKIDRGIKTFHDKGILKKYMNTKPALQNILKEILNRDREDTRTKQLKGKCTPNLEIKQKEK